MIVFMGTPEFSVPILKMLIEEKYPVGLVVTQPDRPVGRKKVLTPSPVKALALAHKIEVFQPENLRADYQHIIDLKPQLIITASYGQILPKELLEAVKSINIHGSLLPKYRGGAPIQYALFNGDKKTGITLMEMVYKMDAGDILEKVSLDIEPADNYGTLSEKLSLLGRDLLKKRLPDILSGTYDKTPQDEAEVTFAFTLKRADELLDFKKSAAWNHNRIRGLSPNIGGHFKIDNTFIKVFESRINDIIELQSGEIYIEQKRLYIGTSHHALELIEVQQSGKKKMHVKDYLNGQNLFINGGSVYE